MVMVKTIARGRQMRRAQKRENGLGDTMLLMLSIIGRKAFLERGESDLGGGGRISMRSELTIE